MPQVTLSVLEAKPLFDAGTGKLSRPQVPERCLEHFPECAEFELTQVIYCQTEFFQCTFFQLRGRGTVTFVDVVVTKGEVPSIIQSLIRNPYNERDSDILRSSMYPLTYAEGFRAIGIERSLKARGATDIGISWKYYEKPNETWPYVSAMVDGEHDIFGLCA